MYILKRYSYFFENWHSCFVQFHIGYYQRNDL